MGAAREPISCCSLLPAAAAVLALLLLLLLLFLFPILCLLPAPQAAIVCLKAFILSTMKPHNLATVCQPHQVVNQPGRLPLSPLTGPTKCSHSAFDVMIYCGCACGDLHPLSTASTTSTVPPVQLHSTVARCSLHCVARCRCGCSSVELKLYLIS